MLYRREGERSNEIWQADHCQGPIVVEDGQGKCGRPWLTVIEDDRVGRLRGIGSRGRRSVPFRLR